MWESGVLVGLRGHRTTRRHPVDFRRVWGLRTCTVCPWYGTAPATAREQPTMQIEPVVQNRARRWPSDLPSSAVGGEVTWRAAPRTRCQLAWRLTRQRGSDVAGCGCSCGCGRHPTAPLWHASRQHQLVVTLCRHVRPSGKACLGAKSVRRPNRALALEASGKTHTRPRS